MPETNSMPIFLINLDRRTDRLAQMTSKLGKLPFKRISAIDGQNLDDLEFISPITKYKMAKSEIACILSHKKVWQKIVDEKIPYACILEDDINLSCSFPDFIKNANWLPDNFDVIKLETYLQRIILSLKKKKVRDRSLRQLGSIHYGTAGYIVSLQGAIKLLDITQQLDRPVDHLIFDIKITNSEFRVMQMFPALCIQEDILQPDASPSSDIADDRPWVQTHPSQKTHGIHKLWREIKRPYFQMLSLINLLKEKSIKVRYVPFK